VRDAIRSAQPQLGFVVLKTVVARSLQYALNGDHMSTASKTHATGRIDVKTYEPQPLRGSGRRADLVEIHVSGTFSGDIVGEGVARFLQAVRKDGSASFVGDVFGRDRRFDVRRSSRPPSEFSLRAARVLGSLTREPKKAEHHHPEEELWNDVGGAVGPVFEGHENRVAPGALAGSAHLAEGVSDGSESHRIVIGRQRDPSPTWMGSFGRPPGSEPSGRVRTQPVVAGAALPDLPSGQGRVSLGVDRRRQSPAGCRRSLL
jgi:hypothetical protein